MTQAFQTKSGITSFIATVQVVLEDISIHKEKDAFVAYNSDGAKLGPIVGEQVKYLEGEDTKKVKLTSLIPGVDPATFAGKPFNTLSPAEQLAYVKYLEGLAGSKVGKVTAAEAPKSGKAAADKPAADETIALPKTLAELEAMGVKDLIKLAKQEKVKDVTSRTEKKVVVEKLAEKLGLAEAVEEKPAKGGKGKKNEVLKSDDEVDEDDDSDDDDSDDDDSDDSDDDGDDSDDSDDDDSEDDSDDDSDDDDSDDSDDDDSDDDDSDDDDSEDDDSDDDSDDDDDDSDDGDDDDSDDSDDDGDDDDDQDDEDAGLAKLRKKWSPKKIDELEDKEEINALRKAIGITYAKGEKLSTVRVKEDIKKSLFGKSGK